MFHILKNGILGLIAISVALLAGVPSSALCRVDEPAMATQAQPQDPELAQKFALAEGHHDLAELYIKKGELDKAVAECRQIIQLRFPPDYEGLVAQSLSILTERFAEIRRFDLGQMLLDEALRSTELNANRARIYANKARLFKLAGDNDRAIESWKKALELEGRRVR